MINALKGYSASRNYNLSTSNRPIRHWLLVLIAAFTLSACGSQNETTGSSPQQGENVSIQIPDAAGKLDQIAGTLTATISVNGGAPQAMTISGTSASVTLDSIPTGTTTFTIVFSYELASFGALVVASATRTLDVLAGSNTLSFAAADYDTASFDEDGDGISNIVELDEASISSPVVSLCILDTAKLDNCELGS